MWLIVRGNKARCSFDLNGGVIWHNVSDSYFSIDFRDGRLYVILESAERATRATDRLLLAVRESRSFFDTADEDWGPINAEWQYFEDEREDKGPTSVTEAMGPDDATDDEDDDDDDDREAKPPLDRELRVLWDAVSYAREFRLRNWPSRIEEAILEICRGRFLSAEQIGAVLDKSHNSVRVHFLNTMVKEGKLLKEFPEKRSHPRQRYTSASSEADTD